MLEANKKKIGVAVFSFNRPFYLRKVLESFETNTGLENFDFFLFQDGSINQFSQRLAADQHTIDLCVKFWKQANLPNKTLIRHPYNLGIGISQFQAKEYLFNNLGYDECMFFEDDLIISKHYLRILKLLLEQFSNEESVGAVMCYGELFRRFSKEDETSYIASVHAGNHQLWGWATWKKKWLKIKPEFLRYFQFIKNIDYKDRPSDDILNFYKKNGSTINTSSQDAAFNYALNKCDMFSLNTWLHRAKYIGADGEHMRPELYRQLGFDDTNIFENEQDVKFQVFTGFDADKFLKHSKAIFSA